MYKSLPLGTSVVSKSNAPDIKRDKVSTGLRPSLFSMSGMNKACGNPNNKVKLIMEFHKWYALHKMYARSNVHLNTAMKLRLQTVTK